ncbi:MAG TPA: GNAT family N-acetyltransferase, partial [Anaerolineae bacterium]|nr:GNAT family N-acetyltransferase [Anaerolineae bacterium]
QYITSWTMRDGTPITFRPIRPEDEPLIVKFHESLSDRSVYLRFLHPMLLGQRVAHERLARICFNDYDRELALVAERKNPATGEREIIAVGRLSKTRGADEARFSMLISDAYQGRGLGSELLRNLLSVARQEKLRRITAAITSDNVAMQSVARKLGFRLEAREGSMMTAVIDLT